MSFGPNPWQQTNWDWRAAGNFMCGGAGAGLIVFAALSRRAGPASRRCCSAAWRWSALGLLCVLARTRPSAARAERVLQSAHLVDDARGLRRDAADAAVALALVGGLAGLAWLAAALALVFVYCQARMLQAAKGIPAWREPLTVPLIVATGLAEGGGLFWLLALAAGHGARRCWTLFGAGCWRAPGALAGLAPRVASAPRRARWRRSTAPGAAFNAGTLLPLALLSLGGGCAVVAGLRWPRCWSWPACWPRPAGAWFKFTLITRAGFNQGFALAHLPVRGVRRSSSRPSGGFMGAHRRKRQSASRSSESGACTRAGGDAARAARPRCSSQRLRDTVRNA